MRRVLHIFGRMDYGGAEMRTLEVMRHIDRTTFQLDFCSLSGRRGALDAAIGELGGRVHHCGFGWDFGRRFRSLLRRNRYDVVHSHVFNTSGYLLRLAAGEGVPMRVAHFRNSHDGRARNLRRNLQRRVMRRWIDKYATHILAVSRAAMSAAWSPQWENDPRCHVVYNGIDLSPFDEHVDRDELRAAFGLPAGCPLYIHVGRLTPAKNHERLLSIFAEVLRLEPDARLLVVGPDEKEQAARIRRLAGGISQDDRLVFAGSRDDVPRLMLAADLLLFPSLWEGLPGVVLEAAAAGLPVLASDLPETREISPYLLALQLISLDKPDAEWARQAVALRASYRDPCIRGATQRGFAETPFRITVCAEAHARLWNGLTARARSAKPIPFTPTPTASAVAGG